MWNGSSAPAAAAARADRDHAHRCPQSGRCSRNNPWNPAFGDRVAFADLAGARRAGPATAESSSAATATLAQPAALSTATPLSGRVGSGLDPCAALQTTVEIAPNGVAEIVFFLGDAAR